MPRSDFSAGWGWAAIAALVGVWDLGNRQSLTSYARAHKVATTVLGGITLAHLTGVLPEAVDPFEWVRRVVRPAERPTR
jgi:ABC-type Mn2+/Zn2+ transport system permease subunit